VQVHKRCREILLEMGYFFQVQVWFLVINYCTFCPDKWNMIWHLKFAFYFIFYTPAEVNFLANIPTGKEYKYYVIKLLFWQSHFFVTI
jgi:hypothetical protein